MSNTIRALPSLLRLAVQADLPLPDTSPHGPPLSEVARLLGLPLLPDFRAAGQMLEVRVPWLPVSLWFVGDEAAVELLMAEGVTRGRVWTAAELVDLFRIPGLTKVVVQTVARAKWEFLGEVAHVRPHPPTQAALPGLEPAS